MKNSNMIRAALCLLFGALHLASARAEDVLKKSVAVDIPPQQLTQALIALSKQAGIQVLMPADLVGGLNTRGAQGQMSLGEAMTRLLQGTQLKFHSAGDNTIGVREARAGASGTAQPHAGFMLARRDEPAAQSAAAATQAPGTEAGAGEAAGTVPELLVKGARVLNSDIKRTRDDAQAYVVFDREQIAQSTATNLEQFLRDRLPMNAAGLENGQRPTSFGNQSAINLRGLGTNQTLILIDGRRAVGGGSYGSSPVQPDVNAIPLSAIERIEVLPGTASGIHGGGATGGVINIIMRHDYAGAELKATYGNSFDSDVASRRVDFSAGFNLDEGRTHVLFSSMYSDQNLMRQQERRFFVDRFFEIARTNDPSVLLPPNSPPIGTTPNIRSATTGTLLQFKDAYGGASLNSQITHLPKGYAGATVSGVAALLNNAGQYNTELPESWQVTSGLQPMNMNAVNKSAGATLRREFTPRFSAFLEGSFNQAKTSAPVMFGSGSRVGAYRVLASAPNNPFTTDVLVSFPHGTGPAGEFWTDTRQFRAVGGFIASLPAGWQLAADHTWSRQRRTYEQTTRVASAQDQTLIGNGTIDVLRDTGAFPVDLTPYLAPASNALAPHHTAMQNTALRLSGPFFAMPGGPVGLTAQLEYRQEDLDDGFQQSGATSLVYPAKSQSVGSAYLETRFPLITARNARPGVRALEVQLAGRLDRFRTEGSTPFIIGGSGVPLVTSVNKTDSVNPTIALRYQPVEDVALRLSFATGFVAPDVSQLATTTDIAPLTVNDPRRGNDPVTIPGSSVLRGGNPNLKPEESENWSAGFILTPSALPGLRLSLDYLRIRKTDNITTYPGTVQGLVNDEQLFPERVQRGAPAQDDPPGYAGPITLLDVSLFNIARAEVEALDMQLDYNWSTRFGQFAFFTVASRHFHYRTQGFAGQPVIENVGYTWRFPRKLTGTAELKWTRDGWTAGWISRYHDAYMAANPQVAGSGPANTLQGNGGWVPRQTYHDLFLGWRPQASAGTLGTLLADTELQLNIRNVMDKAPPFDAGLYLIFRDFFYSSLGDALQRSYQVSMTKRF